MPNNYNGNAALANFAIPIPIILDGEDFQYGNSGSGYFSNIKIPADRIAWLKLHSGQNDGDNTWSGTNVFEGTGQLFVFSSQLNQVAMAAPFFHIQNGCVTDVQAGAELRVKNLGKIILEAGSIYTDAADRTIAGASTFTGPIIHSGDGGAEALRAPTTLGAGAGGPPTTLTIANPPKTDTYTIATDLAQNQDIRLGPPDDTTQRWKVVINRTDSNANSKSVSIKDDGTGAVIGGFEAVTYLVLHDASGGGATYSVKSTHAWIEAVWSVSAGAWKLRRGGGPGFFVAD